MSVRFCTVLKKEKKKQPSEHVSFLTVNENSSCLLVLVYLLEETKQDISVDCPLVGFIQHDNGVLAQLRVDQTLSQQHTVCHVLDHSLRAGAVLKTDSVTHLESKKDS